jgi:phosphatidate cytidylyltransferase
MIRQRVISALILAALLVTAVLWLPPLWSAAALTLVLAAAAWEWSGFVARDAMLQRLAFMLVTAMICGLWWWWSAQSGSLRILLWVALTFWSLALLWVFALPTLVNRPLVAVVGVLALSLAWVALVRMRVDWSQGRYAVLFVLLVVWVADSGAFFAGRAWGVRKLAPSVSPGKTWAGLWGGLAACALLALLASLWWQVPVVALVVATLIVGVYSVVGDLAESLCKRFAGLKDSSNLIPGHGGVLDRFDSLLAAAPVLMLVIQLLQEHAQ